jgi:DNA polymerase-3 subunit delta
MKRVADSMNAGKPLHMALREQRVWGAKEKQFERIMPDVQMPTLHRLLQAAHLVDGVVKGLKHPDWPTDPWQALHRLAQMVVKLS